MTDTEQTKNAPETVRNGHKAAALPKTEKKAAESRLDAIRGCIFGGAVGDALGYPVEFLDEEMIFEKFGQDGITAYETARSRAKARISDDTQMTLFTANGLLVGDTRGAMRGIRGEPRVYAAKAYQDWLKTQERSMQEVNQNQRYTDAGIHQEGKTNEI